MMKSILTQVGLALVAASAGAQAPPSTDVFVATLSVRGAAVTVTAPRNVTAREGYDNQPSFSPDGRALFYTSVRDDAQADIYRRELPDGKTTRLTVTAPESEYSAAMVPGTTDLAVIRVERDSTQRLWRVPANAIGKAGAMGTVLLAQVKPTGYFAFTDARTVALFVLGRPASLQLADTATGRADTIAVNIGRSLHRIPGRNAISYVSKAYENAWWIMSLDVGTRHILPVAKLPEGVEDYAWLPGGLLVAGKGGQLLVCDPAGTAVWTVVADLSSTMTSISRLAVSPAGDRIAIVAAPTQPASPR